MVRIGRSLITLDKLLAYFDEPALLLQLADLLKSTNQGGDTGFGWLSSNLERASAICEIRSAKGRQFELFQSLSSDD
jgi:hypothetical protein